MDAVLALSLVFTTASQFRLPGLPVGPGELGLVVWIAWFVLQTLICGARFSSRAVFTLLLFSLASLACAFAANYQTLLSLRFIQGIGLGGEVPLMAAYVNEFAKAQNRGRF